MLKEVCGRGRGACGGGGWGVWDGRLRTADLNRILTEPLPFEIDSIAVLIENFMIDTQLFCVDYSLGMHVGGITEYQFRRRVCTKDFRCPQRNFSPGST